MRSGDTTSRNKHAHAHTQTALGHVTRGGKWFLIDASASFVSLFAGLPRYPNSPSSAAQRCFHETNQNRSQEQQRAQLRHYGTTACVRARVRKAKGLYYFYECDSMQRTSRVIGKAGAFAHECAMCVCAAVEEASGLVLKLQQHSVEVSCRP